MHIKGNVLWSLLLMAFSVADNGTLLVFLKTFNYKWKLENYLSVQVDLSEILCVHELYCLFWSFIFVGAFYLVTAATYALEISHLGLVPLEYIKYMFIAKSFIFINAPTCYLINSFFFFFFPSELSKWLEPLKNLRFEINCIPNLIEYIKQVSKIQIDAIF